MKKITFTLCALLLCATLFFIAGCNKNAGTAKVIFYWQKPFDDSCIAHSVSTANLFVDGDSIGTLLVGSQYWTYTPTCDEHGTITYSQKNDERSLNIHVRIPLGTVKTIDEYYTIYVDRCQNYELKW